MLRAHAAELLLCIEVGGNYTANYRGCSKWKEAERKGVSTRLPAPAKPSLEQENLGPGWNHVVKADAIKNPAPTPSGAIARTERQAVSKDGNAKPTRPVVPVANPSAPSTKTGPAPGHHRSPGEPPDRGLRRVDTSSSRRGPFPSIGGGKSSSKPFSSS
ncbi:hypothetical protein L798_01030 [Zootermopsis nevadensis]|uniref:Uncharacterized protein n=1 Tax=Zootermopsis nevadensis TaxID=136037 RepID=A0A067QK58_ZOONE|nr:hypothetical protein L798_01030 [Zootermopsis nevadensis]